MNREYPPMHFHPDNAVVVKEHRVMFTLFRVEIVNQLSETGVIERFDAGRKLRFHNQYVDIIQEPGFLDEFAAVDQWCGDAHRRWWSGANQCICDPYN